MKEEVALNIRDRIEEERTSPQCISVSKHSEWRPVSASNLTKERIEEMSKIHVIELMRQMILISGETAQWSVQAKDGVPPEAVELIEMFMEPNKTEVWSAVIDGWIKYGWAPFEKIFAGIRDSMGGLKLGIRKLKQLLPEYSDTLFRGNEFLGIENWVDSPKVLIPPVRSLVLTLDKRGDNMKGRSLFENAEQSAFFFENALKSMMNYASKRKGPKMVGYYPQEGKSYYRGTLMENYKVVEKMKDDLDSTNIVFIPRVTPSPSAAGQIMNPWELVTLPDNPYLTDFLNEFSYWEKAIVMAFGFPVRSIMESEFGSRADSVTGQEFAVQRVQYLVNTLVEQLNRYVVDKLLEMNYPEYIGDVWIAAGDINQRTLANLKTLFVSTLNTNYGQSILADKLDWNQIAREAGFPLVPESTLPNSNLNPFGEKQFAEDDLINSKPPSAMEVMATGGNVS